MGITGLFKELGGGTRMSLAKLAADHYTAHARPLRLAVDISIWLFQIQSGKGGSNPALRTFYYRLLRLLLLNIHPLFVFDGPNKPEWKRGKKVGGPGVRVASVPEFLAKQLLKQFGFPWHVAPGEAEAECALLQREGVVDAVLSEDVDTLMFGSGLTLRNWSAEGSTKSPTHVTVYREEETKASSGMDGEGMVLVALMSGGDYIPTGIAGCGPKLACDAARAGFGKSLCRLKRRDVEGLRKWKEELLHEVRTNTSKHFSRKTTSFAIPDDFPNWEVLGYYTRPCVSTAEKVRQMKESVTWDQDIDFAALRSFTSDAFDWRCIGGAKKFIKNLAPAMLVRRLRLQSLQPDSASEAAQEEREAALVHAIHGKRNHASADGELEYRISFTPANLVPIDLSIEEEDDQFNPAGGNGMDSDAESDFMTLPSSTPAPDEPASEPTSPSKKRTFKPYHPDQPEKLWLLRPFLQLGCPLLVETYEAPIQDPKEFLKARRKARTVGKATNNIHATAKPANAKKSKAVDVQENALMNYARVTKAKSNERAALQELSQASDGKAYSQPPSKQAVPREKDVDDISAAFKMPSTQFATDTSAHPSINPFSSTQPAVRSGSAELPRPRPFLPFADPSTQPAAAARPKAKQQTPRKSKKRRSPDLSSPAASQRTITSYYSPSPRKSRTENWVAETIDLVSSSPAHQPPERPQTPSPGNTRFKFSRTSIHQPKETESDGELELPATVTKRRRKGPLKRALTAPAIATELDVNDLPLPTPTSETGPANGLVDTRDVVNIASSSPMKDIQMPECAYNDADDDDDELPSPSFFAASKGQLPGGFLVDNEVDTEATPQALRQSTRRRLQSRSLDEDDQATTRVDSWLQEQETANLPISASQYSLPTSPPLETTKLAPAAKRPERTSSTPENLRRSPRTQAPAPRTADPPTKTAKKTTKPSTKKVIIPRTSLAGAWEEVSEVEALDLTGDGSGWKASSGRAALVGDVQKGRGFRKSGVEVLDLTGA